MALCHVTTFMRVGIPFVKTLAETRIPWYVSLMLRRASVGVDEYSSCRLPHDKREGLKPFSRSAS